jgi:lambda family phage portal protein
MAKNGRIDGNVTRIEPLSGRRGQPTGGMTARSAIAQHRQVTAGMRRALAGVSKSAVVDRLTQRQASEPMTADQVVERNLRVLVARSRQAAQDNDYGRSYLRQVRRNIIGPRGVGLQVQARDPNGRLDKAANDAIEAAWGKWGRRQNCSVTGRQSFHAIELAVVSSAARDGEFFVRVVYGRNAGPWGFALQVIDPMRVPVHVSQDGRAGGGFIRNGIEYNAFGRALAYLVAVGDREPYDLTVSGGQYVRIPADQMIHGFVEDMTGQKRGLPWMATALWRLNMVEGFEDAALVNARASAAKGGFFEWDEGTGPELDAEDLEDEDPLYIEAEPGTYQELTPGLRFKANNPAYPSGEFQIFLKAMLRGAASGLGVAYNNFANDLEGVNFSSIRSGTLEERDYWQEMQEWVIEGFHAQVYDLWLSHALLAGKIITANGSTLPPAKRDKFSLVHWQGRRWPWIDPVKDVQASLSARDGLLISTGQIIREQGRDPDNVYREIAQDLEAMREAGIPNSVIDGFFQKKTGAALAPENEGSQENGSQADENDR